MAQELSASGVVDGTMFEALSAPIWHTLDDLGELPNGIGSAVVAVAKGHKEKNPREVSAASTGGLGYASIWATTRVATGPGAVDLRPSYFAKPVPPRAGVCRFQRPTRVTFSPPMIRRETCLLRNAISISPILPLATARYRLFEPPGIRRLASHGNRDRRRRRDFRDH